MTEHIHEPGIVLCQQSAGRWLLTTTSGSMYFIDMDERQCTRTPDPDRVAAWLAAGGRVPKSDEFVPLSAIPDAAGELVFTETGRLAAASMRGDAEALPLIGLQPVRIGQRAEFYLEALPGVVTTRGTTPIAEVRAVG